MNPDAKFQLKQIILIVWSKFAQKGDQKGYFYSKRENLNIPIEFRIFELVHNSAQN